MRPIKFRFWSKSKEQIIDDFQIQGENGVLVSDLFGGGILFNSEDLIPLQYTGLKDKNGKDIYEGDIVKFNGYKSKIAWYTLEAKFWLFSIESGDSCSSPTKEQEERQQYPFLWGKNNNCNHIEVIGNVWENKELLNDN